MIASTQLQLARRARADLRRIGLRRRLRRGDPYRSVPVHADVVGADIETFNLDTLRYLVHEIFMDGCYEMGDLPPHPQIVDVGANIGLASLYFHRRYPDASIRAIEADPDVFPLLDRNLRRNLPSADVRMDNVAAHDAATSIKLYRHAAKPGRLTTSTDPSRGGPVAVDVPAMPMSSLVGAHVDLLKIDIEGAEHRVISELSDAGALDRVDRIVLELHTPQEGSAQADETLDRLRRHGFTVRIDGGIGDGWSSVTEDAIVRAARAH